jgi:predicted lipoprotein with Yx(FWY)xxD motif
MRLTLNRTTAIFALAMLIACAATVSPSSAATMRSSPAATRSTSLGPVLTYPKGMTLYVFDKDAAGKSNCNGQCAINWPPLLAPASAKASGDWSVIKRADGKKQWAYKGRPLYDWSKDKKPGDTSGNGLLNGAWHVAQP